MTQLTFEEARAAAIEARAPIWEDDDTPGTYMVADYGYEDDEAFLVFEGAKEYLEDGDADFVVWDAPAVFVDKESGTVIESSFLNVIDRVHAMTPVPGHEPPDDDE